MLSYPLLEPHLRRLARDLRPRRQDAQRSEPGQARRDGSREDVGAGVFDGAGGGAGSFHQRYFAIPALARLRRYDVEGVNQLMW